MSPASVSDVESRWRILSEAEQSVVSVRLDDAWNKLRRLAPGVDVRAEQSQDVSDAATTAVADCVIRFMQALARNGVRRGLTSVDDASTQWEMDSSIAFTLEFTADEIASVSGGQSYARVFSVMPS